jgi:hypothetical protein
MRSMKKSRGKISKKRTYKKSRVKNNKFSRKRGKNKNKKNKKNKRTKQIKKANKKGIVIKGGSIHWAEGDLGYTYIGNSIEILYGGGWISGKIIKSIGDFIIHGERKSYSFHEGYFTNIYESAIGNQVKLNVGGEEHTGNINKIIVEFEYKGGTRYKTLSKIDKTFKPKFISELHV